jgi:hypothetical protein
MHNFTARIACTILALGFGDGMVGAWLYRHTPVPPSALVFVIACIFFVFLWFRLDSDSRSYQRSPFLSTAVVGLSVIAIPYYLFQTRGVRRGSIGTLVFASLMLGYTLMGVLGRLIVFAVRS